MGPQSVKFVRQIVVENKLFLASPLSFNDPFDALPYIDMKGTVRKERAYYRRLTRTYRPDLSRPDRIKFADALMAMSREDKLRHLREGAYETARGMAVCSFAQSPNEVLMWSHYADNHSGICLQFNTDNSFFRSSLPLQVKYSKKRPSYNAIDPGPPAALVDIMLTKADFWSYENEWRLIEPRGGGIRSFPQEALSAIYLGCRASEENKALLRSWVAERRRPLEVYQGEASVSTFELNFVRVE
ncbi:MAG TPA: DUF2971 domain-containing protein [Phenylobacterium sp.]|jgi:hypothetical protein|nr:DUF2971 domain-containing protein [Phenylobacterium sp.]